MALDGPFRDPGRLGCLGQGQASEEPELDDPGTFRIDLLEPI